MSKTYESLPVIQNYQQLENELEQLGQVIKREHLSVQLNSFSEIEPIDRVVRAIRATTYDDDQEGRALVQLSGVVFVPAHVADLIQRVNDTKSSFLNEVQQAKGAIKLKSPTSKSRHIREIFASFGINRIHFKQCERQLVVIKEGVKSISFFIEAGGWGCQKKFSKADLMKFLHENYDPSEPERDLIKKRMSSIPEDEVLVQRSKSPDSQKAVISLMCGKKEVKVASLPIFVVAEKACDISLVAIKQNPSTKRLGNAKNRSKFEDEPVLPSFRIYRYKKQYR